jgi:hypothetical protein
MARDPRKRHAEKITVLQMIEPRRDRDPSRMDPSNKAVASVWIDTANKTIVREGGYDQHPWIMARWSKEPGELYGRGPIMEQMPDIMQLNAMRRLQVAGMELANFPPLIASTNAITRGAIVTTPNGVTWTRGGIPPNQAVSPMNLGQRPDLTHQQVETERAGIRSGLYLDLLQPPDKTHINVPQTIAWMQQQLIFFSPQLARVQNEWLGPQIKLLFRHALDTGRLRTPPAELSGRAMRIEYTSIMATAQKANEVASLDTALRLLAPFIQTNPDVLDIFDTDAEGMPLGVCRNVMVPEKFLRSASDAAARRRARQEVQLRAAQAEVAAVQAQAAASGAKALRDASEAGVAA